MTLRYEDSDFTNLKVHKIHKSLQILKVSITRAEEEQIITDFLKCA